MLLGEVVDELHDENGLADAGAAEQARFATTNVGLEKVDDLDAGLEGLGLGGELVEGGCRTVNRIGLLDLGHRLAIDRLADDVPDATEGLVADRHLDGSTGVNDLGAALKAVRAGHGDRTDHIALQVHLDLEHGRNVTDWSISIHRERVVDRRDGISRKLAVYDSTNDANDASNVLHSCVLILLVILYSSKAAAPPTISVISVVMAPWRTRLYRRSSVSIISVALSVADFIALRRAPCSAAAESMSA